MSRKKPADSEEPTYHGYPFPFRKLSFSDSAISEINAMLDWHAGTLLGTKLLGRLGGTPNKRMQPGEIPDYRIAKLDELISLKGKSILEVGCFEGIHTLGLRLYSDDVTAIDVRPSNVINTLTRLSMHGSDAKVFTMDVETLSEEFGQFDLIFHCGVLYPLMSPIEHLFSIAPMCRRLFVDTHIAQNEAEIRERTFQDFTYKGAYHDEGGWLDPFSGKDPRSFWLTREALQDALMRAGFSSVDVLEERAERNGPRLAILATR